MKKRISTNLRWVRFIPAVVFMALLYSIVNLINSHNRENEALIGICISAIVCVLLYFIFDSAKKVEFDQNHMFITSKNGEERIPLKNIHVIKLTSLEINKRKMWKIKYTDNYVTEKSVRILPRLFNNEFEKFKDAVYKANNKVLIQKWTHTFDFDQ
ncbi:hypothetical protein [Flavobacterium okayamense]|uniref:PH domain-containing protein n=1 Tax=Flavobacterium okayamense TaxID=2830782 RepID=A0ABM7S7J1_9FLAO|nr:hypothetical protein [Flavobacterium okayamense]BCY29590.1 hypothetical protein KK2020170_24580 [Flavobacterium okayamense]